MLTDSDRNWWAMSWINSPHSTIKFTYLFT